LLELARVWAKSAAPKRSILFACVTAEEQGLLGSEYFGKHPSIPASKISLDLNYDALAPLGEPEEVEVSGAERTTFYPAVEAVAKEFKLAIKPDAQPGAGHYYRSDHFSLSRVGIPAFSISEGMKFKGHDTAWGEAQAKDYVDYHYHQVSDEFHENWNFSGLVKMTRFGFELGMKAANQPRLVEWHKGDEFEAARKAGFAAALSQTPLFANLRDLQLIESLPLRYPPLARQTRTAGDVRVRVVVNDVGEISEATVVSGHPLLAQAALDTVRSWKFRPVAGGKQFDVICSFTMSGKLPHSSADETSVIGPLHIGVLSDFPPVETIYARLQS
jgi:TonB family protein